MIIRSAPPLVFVHIPKTAGGSISKALIRSGDLEVPNRLGCHSTALEIQQCFPLLWQHAFKFAVVRDPLDLCVSRWLEFERADERYPHLKGMRKAYVDAFGDFSGWVRFISRYGNAPNSAEEQLIGSRTNREWVRWWFHSFHATHSEMLCDANGNLLVDQVLDFNRVKTDIQPILAKYGNGSTLRADINTTRPTDKKSWYTEETTALIKQHFAQDYLMFGCLADCGMDGYGI